MGGRHSPLKTIDRVQLQDRNVNMEELRFWKVDISGAFTWLDFRPSDVHCMAQEMENDRVFISLVGVFGASILPFAFNVITKVMRSKKLPVVAPISMQMMASAVAYFRILIGKWVWQPPYLRI